jgi:hypothetical protein
MVESFAPPTAGLSLARKVRGGGGKEAILDVAREQERFKFRAGRISTYRPGGEEAGKEKRGSYPHVERG